MVEFDSTSIIIGAIIGLLVGIPLGWLIANLAPKGKLIERDKDGNIVAIIPA